MMPALPVERYYGEIGASTAVLAAIVESADQALPIPTCPDWTLRHLATHLGRAQRWAGEIVATRSAEFIEFRSVPDGKLPEDQAERGQWLNAGAGRLIDALRGARTEMVWAFGESAPASFWARRMSHEAMVHRADAELAAGADVTMTPDLAADAIDEWLTVMSGQVYGRPDPRLTALPRGRALHVHATDSELAGGEWLVRHSENGIRVSEEHGGGDVALSGRAADVLLVLLGRRPPSDDAVRVYGDQDLLGSWLDGIKF